MNMKIYKEISRKLSILIWDIPKKARENFCSSFGHTYKILAFKTKNEDGGYCAVCGWGIYSVEHDMINSN